MGSNFGSSSDPASGQSPVSATVRVKLNHLQEFCASLLVNWNADAAACTVRSYIANPIGSVQLTAAAAAPTNWLLCDGTAVSRSTYALLFAVIGTTYGAGNGTTTFNVPDVRGRTVIMVDGAAARVTSASLDGANADTLGGVGGLETHVLLTAEIPAHTHPTSLTGVAGSILLSAGTARATTDGFPTGSTGGGGAHSNTQPWIAMNYIIYTGL